MPKKTANGQTPGADIEATCFSINRFPGQAKQIYDRLPKQPDQTPKKRKNDYEDRAGVTQDPVLPDENLLHVCPLHGILRCTDWVCKLCYHLRSKVYVWSEGEKTLSADEMDRYKKAKKEIKAYVKDKTGIRMDAADSTGNSGNTNTGNICQRLMTTHREVLVECVPEDDRPALRELLARLWIIEKVYASSSLAASW